MLSKFVLLFVAPLSIAAVEFGVLVPKQNNARSIPTTGGWSLQANACPTGTSICGAAWCCPNSLTCVRSGYSDNAEACCPTGETFVILDILPETDRRIRRCVSAFSPSQSSMC